MLRFTQMNFNVRPEKDGFYIVFYKGEKAYIPMSFTTEFGWNTTRFSNGEIDSINVIPDEDMKDVFGHWLKPYTIGSNYWFDEIETMLDEVKADLKEYNQRLLTEDEMEREENLKELRDLLEKAKDFAEVLR